MLVDDNILKLDTVDAEFIQFLDRPCCPYDVEHQIETLASYKGHVIVQTIFLRGSYEGTSCDNTGDEYVAPWLEALKRIAPQAVTIYTIDRPTPAQGLEKAPAEILDAIAERVRALGSTAHNLRPSNTISPRRSHAQALSPGAELSAL